MGIGYVHILPAVVTSIVDFPGDSDDLIPISIRPATGAKAWREVSAPTAVRDSLL